LLVGGQATSTVGDACYAVALPWYVLTSHGGAAVLGRRSPPTVSPGPWPCRPAVSCVTGSGELIIVTALQRSFPAAVLGRIMGLVMLASAGAFPISVALTTAMVHSAGAAAVFPLAGALTAAAILFGLSRPRSGVSPRNRNEAARHRG
jgi:hypothetical protein